MEKQSYFRYSTYRVQVDELLDMSCALLVSGGQILEGDVELFVKRNISMIPSEVPHSSTEVRINSKKQNPRGELAASRKTFGTRDDAVSYNCYNWITPRMQITEEHQRTLK